MLHPILLYLLLYTITNWNTPQPKTSEPAIRIAIGTPFSIFHFPFSTLQDTLAQYFEEARLATQAHKQLWDKDIYGPLLIVHPLTRMAYAPQPDTAGVLKPTGKIYAGTLPMTVPIANASQHWGGVHWAMIILPFIPQDKHDRTNLFTHELFHRAQESLGFIPQDANNGHLDEKDGRTYLRLELAALEQAVQTQDKKVRLTHIHNALLFRKCRFQQYPGADSTENVLDINEGIAEYTGVMMSGRDPETMRKRFLQKNQELLMGASFIRTFSYRNIPMYGYLLQQTNRYWNKEITPTTNLTAYFTKAFQVQLPADAITQAQEILAQYGGEKILTEENAREEENKKRTAEYKHLFIDQPHFVIPFQKKKVSFDTRTIFTLLDKGTVYPVMEATDVWGVLQVERVGGLMSPDRTTVTLTPPLKTEGNTITGDGWTLTLTPGYTVVKDQRTGNWELKEKR